METINTFEEVDISEMPVTTRRRRKVEGVLDMMNIKNFVHFDTSWREHASCRNNDMFITEDFFYVTVTRKNISHILAMQELCSHCPVAAACLHEAMMFNYDGCWAGFTNAQRTAYIRSERNNTVEGLSISECQDILNSMRDTIDKPMTRAARRAQYKRKPPA